MPRLRLLGLTALCMSCGPVLNPAEIFTVGGDDDSSSGEATGDGSEGGPGGSTVLPSTSTASSTTGPAVTTGASTEADTSSTAAGSEGSSGADTTGEPLPENCYDARTVEQCLALGCDPWLGQEWFLAAEGWCLGLPELLDCEGPIACLMAEHVCDGEKTWAMTQGGCIPSFMFECEPPSPDPVPNCND